MDNISFSRCRLIQFKNSEILAIRTWQIPNFSKKTQKLSIKKYIRSLRTKNLAFIE